MLRRLSVVLLPLALALPVLAVLPETAAATPAAPAAAKAAQCRRTLPSYPILRAGDRGPAVRTLQCALNDLGLGPVEVDGWYGPQTQAVVHDIVENFEGGPPPRPYRINNGMWTLLHGCQLPDRNLKLGDHGHAVTVLQRALRAAGATVVVDGDFGPQTRDAVKTYQRAQQSGPVDGVVRYGVRFLLCMGGVIGELS